MGKNITGTPLQVYMLDEEIVKSGFFNIDACRMKGGNTHYAFSLHLKG